MNPLLRNREFQQNLGNLSLQKVYYFQYNNFVILLLLEKKKMIITCFSGCKFVVIHVPVYTCRGIPLS